MRRALKRPSTNVWRLSDLLLPPEVWPLAVSCLVVKSFQIHCFVYLGAMKPLTPGCDEGLVVFDGVACEPDMRLLAVGFIGSPLAESSVY